MCCVFACFITKHVFNVHPCCSMYQYFIPFYCQIISDCMDIPHFVYPFITDKYLSCFYLLTIMISSMNIHVMFLFGWAYVFIPVVGI